MRNTLYLGLLLISFSCAQEEVVELPPEKPTIGEMALVPAGEFIFGSNDRPIDAPEQTIDLPAYYIDYYEVTFGQWMKFTTESEYQPEGNWRQFYSIGKEDFPVTNVTWEDAKKYAEWAGKRLPTEQEWEKAARGPDGLAYPWGEEWSAYKSNCNERGYRNTIEVGEIETDKSPYGVYDMMGNVQEWTADELKPYPESPAAKDEAFRLDYVAVRGASYAMRGSSMTLWTRSGYYAKSQYGLGFRCVKDVEEEEPIEEPTEEPTVEWTPRPTELAQWLPLTARNWITNPLR